MRKPNFFIVGAPKTGTTSFYAYLDGHPDVFMSPVKEPNFFSPDVMGTHRQSRWKYPEETDGYLTLYENARDEKRVGEASTSYLVSHAAPQAVHDFAPDALIIAMVRHPVDLMYSLHNERVSNGAEPIADFEEALAADEDRRDGKRLPENFNALGAVYRDNALLGDQLQRWISAYGRDRVHVIVFSDLASNTPREFRRTLEFLGVDPTYEPSSFEARNKSWKRRQGFVQKVIRSGPLQWVRHSIMPRLMGENAAFKMTRRFTKSRFNRRDHQRPQLRPELVRELEDWFADDVALLGRLIGRDLLFEWFDRTGPAPARDRATATTPTS